jgi:site-specific recombinase XerD
MGALPDLLASYLSVHLPGARGCSKNTIAAYRDAFVLFLRFLSLRRGTPPDKADWACLAPDVVEDFLSWLETDRGSSASTRNHRLAAIKAFLRYAQARAPELIAVAAPVLAIQPKRSPQPRMAYISVEALGLLLAEAMASGGVRDAALIALLYDTGARVQEVVDLEPGDLALARPATARLTGKGGKTRTVPITPQAADLVAKHLGRAGTGGQRVFLNRGGQPITRSGVAWILSRHATAVRARRPELMPERISPHVMRRSKAMHLLENGVNLVYIRDLLGHASVTTTEIYAKANPEMKRKAIEAAAANIVPETGYGPEKRADLIDWLKRLV